MKIYWSISISLLTLIILALVTFGDAIEAPINWLRFKLNDASIQASVTIDGAIEFQTIEGWGVTHHVFGDWLSNYPIPYENAAAQIKSLGFDYAFIPSDPFELVNDDSDAFNYNWSSYNQQFRQRDTDFFRRCKYLQDEGLKLIVSIYNYNYADWATDAPFGNRSGNHIRSSEQNIYDEVAEYWTALLHYAKNNHNLAFDYISIQNEPNPDGAFTYWSPTELSAGIKALGTRLKKEGFNAKILTPDDATALSSKNYLQTALQDPAAKSYIDHIAFHAYDGGIPYGTADDAIGGISNLAEDPLVKNSGLRLWMTEWAHGTTQMEKALEYAKLIYNTQVYGNATNYFVWASTAYPTGFFANSVTDGKIDILKYGHGITQYTKYIPPGSVRIAANLNGVSNVFVTAYKHNDTEKFTIVFINRNANSQAVNVNINNIQRLPKLDVICTSANLDSAYLGQVSITENSFVYTLPGESITTFTSNFKKTKVIKVRR